MKRQVKFILSFIVTVFVTAFVIGGSEGIDRLPQYLRILMSISCSKYFEATSFYVEFVTEYKCKLFEESMFDANFAKASVQFV